MTQEEKQLLLKDLCQKLPYGVYVLVRDTFEHSTVPFENVYLKSSDISSLIDSISLNERYSSNDKRFNRIIKERKDFLEFKPYLRPMSSMTKEEKENLQSLHDIISDENYGDGYSPSAWDAITEWEDYCNSRHLDYRGLIGKGLALEAPEGMYKTE